MGPDWFYEILQSKPKSVVSGSVSEFNETLIKVHWDKTLFFVENNPS